MKSDRLWLSVSFLGEIKKMKAQGSLEYLIIIAAVLVVSGVVAMLVTGSTISNKDAAIVTSCQAAAKQCALLRKADSSIDCDFCDEQCVNEAGEPVIPSAVDCCKLGNSDAIYEGSVETCVYTPPEPPFIPPACTPLTFDEDCPINAFGYDEACVNVSCPSGECVYDTVSFEGEKCNDRIGFIDVCTSGICIGTEITECNDIESDNFCPSGCNAIKEDTDFDVDCASDCGNGVVEVGEVCEPNIFTETCADLGYEGGTLNCDNRCEWDTSACSSPDVGSCEAISDEDARGMCYRQLAIDYENSSYCIPITSNNGFSDPIEQIKDDCYLQVARLTDNYSLCPNIISNSGFSNPIEHMKDRCYYDVGINTLNVSLCSLIISNSGFSEPEYIRDQCYSYVAIGLCDSSICANIISNSGFSDPEYIKDNCYVNTASC